MRASPRPRPLVTAQGDAVLYTREQSLELARRVLGYMTAPDGTVAVASSSEGMTHFARNEVDGGREESHCGVSFVERLDRRQVSLETNELDQVSLRDAVTKSEALARALTVLGAPSTPEEPRRPAPAVNPLLWSDRSASADPEQRLAAITTSLAAVKASGLIGAGRMAMRPRTLAVLTHGGHFEYGRQSTCAYLVTARTEDGTGSGWAGWEGEDWSKADVAALTARAIDLATRSRNPVAVEPGRYTVVMTPEAVGALVGPITRVLGGPDADRGLTPFSKSGGGNKIGMRVLDDRLTLSADPMDPEGGFLPFAYFGRLLQYVPVTWIEHGVLTMLSYPTRAMAAAHGLDQVYNSGVLRMSGGPTSIEEMIASTTRGIYVTRFSDVSVITDQTLYMTGVTRDGTFLIEKGKLTKPIKNMRFEDSPFFFLNNLRALGPATRVSHGHVMPSAMVQDFAFTSLTDAV